MSKAQFLFYKADGADLEWRDDPSEQTGWIIIGARMPTTAGACRTLIVVALIERAQARFVEQINELSNFVRSERAKAR